MLICYVAQRNGKKKQNRIITKRTRKKGGDSTQFGIECELDYIRSSGSCPLYIALLPLESSSRYTSLDESEVSFDLVFTPYHAIGWTAIGTMPAWHPIWSLENQ